MIGETMQARFAHHRFTQAELADLGKQVLTALALLHRRAPPMFYGTITPANLELAPDGTIVLVGAGERPLDAAADLYGLGMTLHLLGTKTRQSRAFAGFVRTMTAPDAAQRFPTATAALAALAAVPARARPSRTALVRGLAIGALVGAGLAFGGWHLAHRGGLPAAPAAKLETIRLPDRSFPRPPGLVAPNERGGSGRSR